MSVDLFIFFLIFDLVCHAAAQTPMLERGAKVGASLCPRSDRDCIRFVFMFGNRASNHGERMPSACPSQCCHPSYANAAGCRVALGVTGSRFPAQQCCLLVLLKPPRQPPCWLCSPSRLSNSPYVLS